MTDVYDFLSENIKEFERKIKEVYERKMIEHQQHILATVTKTFTDRHGAIEFTETHAKANKIIEKNKHISYLILCLDIRMYTQPNCIYQPMNNSKLYIDNYGDYLYFCPDRIDVEPIYSKTQGKITYPFPDFLIDFVKNTIGKKQYDTNQMKEIFDILKQTQNLAEHYYKKFVKYEPLFESNKLIEYESILEVVNSKKFTDIQFLEERIKLLEKTNDELRTENESIKESSRTLMKEKDDLNVKNIKLKNIVKKLTEDVFNDD